MTVDWKEIERLRREEQESAPPSNQFGGSTSKGTMSDVLPLTGSVPPEVAAAGTNSLLEATSFVSRAAGQAVQTGQDMLANKFSGMAGADPSLNTDVNLKDRFSLKGLGSAPTLGQTIMDAGDVVADESARIGSQSEDPVIRDIMQNYLPKAIKVAAATGAMAGEMAIPIIPGVGMVKGARKIVQEMLKGAEEEALVYAGKSIERAQEFQELLRNQYPDLAQKTVPGSEIMLGGGQKESLGDLLSSKFEQPQLTDVSSTKELPLDFDNPVDKKAIDEKLKSIGFHPNIPVGGLEETIYDKIAKNKSFYMLSPNKRDIPLFYDYLNVQKLMNKLEVEGLPIGRTITDELIYASVASRTAVGRVHEALQKGYSNLSQKGATDLSFALSGKKFQTNDPIFKQAFNNIKAATDEAYSMALEGANKSGKNIEKYLKNWFPKTIPTHYIQKIINGDTGVNEEVWAYLAGVAEDQGKPKFVKALMDRMKKQGVTWKAEKMPDEKIVANLNFPRSPDGTNILEDLMKYASKEDQLSLLMTVTAAEIKKAYVDVGLKNINQLMEVLPSGSPIGTVRAREWVQGVVEEAFGLRRVNYGKWWQRGRDFEFVNKFILNPLVGLVNTTQLPLTLIPQLGFKASMRPMAELAKMSQKRGLKATKQFVKEWAEKMGVDKIENPFISSTDGKVKHIASIASGIGPTDRGIAWYGSYAKYLDDIEKGVSEAQAIKNARNVIGEEYFTSQVAVLNQMGYARGNNFGAEAMKTMLYLKTFELRQLGFVKDLVNKAVKGDAGPLTKYIMVSQMIGGPQVAGIDYIANAVGITSGDDKNRDRIIKAVKDASVAALTGINLNSRMGMGNTFRYSTDGASGENPFIQWLTSSPVLSDMTRIWQSYKDVTQGRPFKEVFRNLIGINPFLRRGVDLADAIKEGVVRDLKGRKIADFDPNFANIIKMALGGVSLDPEISGKRDLEFKLKQEQEVERTKKSNKLRGALNKADSEKSNMPILDYLLDTATGNAILDGRNERKVADEIELRDFGGTAPRDVDSNTLVQHLIKNSGSLTPKNKKYIEMGIKSQYLSSENTKLYLEYIEKEEEDKVIEIMKQNKGRK